MADSDTEDETFVKNVIHELSAFQKQDTTTDTENVSEPVSSKHSTEMSSSDSSTVAADNGETGKEDASSETGPKTTQLPEPVKQPSRIIRLSRPSNPYGPLRTTVSSETTTSSSLTSSQATSSVVNGSATGSAAGMRTPGRRLAALQRPGSPMHRILQRAMSPALTAAARMTRQPSGDNTYDGVSLNRVCFSCNS